MTFPIYPYSNNDQSPGLAFPVKWTTTYFNQSQKTVTGGSVDIQLAPDPLHTFELQYEFLRNETGFLEWQTLLNFFASQSGTFGRFALDNPDDSQATNAPFGTGDGTTLNFPLRSPLAPLANTWTVGPIKGTISAGNPNIRKNGTLLVPGTDYVVVIDTAGRTLIEFAVAPAVAAALTYDANYFYWVKFAEDMVTFEKFTGVHWRCVSVKLQTVRVNA